MSRPINHTYNPLNERIFSIEMTRKKAGCLLISGFILTSIGIIVTLVFLYAPILKAIGSLNVAIIAAITVDFGILTGLAIWSVEKARQREKLRVMHDLWNDLIYFGHTSNAYMSLKINGKTVFFWTKDVRFGIISDNHSQSRIFAHGRIIPNIYSPPYKNHSELGPHRARRLPIWRLLPWLKDNERTPLMKDPHPDYPTDYCYVRLNDTFLEYQFALNHTTEVSMEELEKRAAQGIKGSVFEEILSS